MRQADPKPSEEDGWTGAAEESQGKQGASADDEDEAAEKGCSVKDVNGESAAPSFQRNANTRDSTATNEPSDQDGSPGASERSEGKKRAREHYEDQDGHDIISVKSTKGEPVLFRCLSDVTRRNRAQRPTCFGVQKNRNCSKLYGQEAGTNRWWGFRFRSC